MSRTRHSWLPWYAREISSTLRDGACQWPARGYKRREIPVTFQGGVDDAQGAPRLVLHGLQKRGVSLIVQEDGDAPSEAGADREDARMVVIA